MITSETPRKHTLFTHHGIPIRNLWHMLLYAWNEVPLKSGWMVREVEHAPTLDALLASILVKLMEQRLRIGLGHDYVEEKQTLRGLRGRIDFGESLKRRTFERGETHSDFQKYSANSTKNQIIRSTLTRLTQAGQFGPQSESVKELRHKLRVLSRALDGVDLIEVTLEMIPREESLRLDRDYRLMLAICGLVLQRQTPTASEGGSVVPEIDREALVLQDVYERFVANFYRVHLRGWEVSAQKRLEWHTKRRNEHLPQMVPDLMIQEKSSGRMVILDTKFTAHSLVENQWGKPVFDSPHLYQLYAYLRSQEHLSDAHRSAVGILLYPAVQYRFADRIELQDHVMRIEFIDLATRWEEIERQLLELIRREEPL